MVGQFDQILLRAIAELELHVGRVMPAVKPPRVVGLKRGRHVEPFAAIRRSIWRGGVLDKFRLIERRVAAQPDDFEARFATQFDLAIHLVRRLSSLERLPERFTIDNASLMFASETTND